MKTELPSETSKEVIAEELLLHKREISAEYGNDVRKLADALREPQIGNPLVVSPPAMLLHVGAV